MSILNFFKKLSRSKTNSESEWLVKIDNDMILTKDYEGIERSFNYNEIKEIYIETNDTGPWLTDLWWRVISTNGTILSIPGGATGESEMLEEFQKLSNFDNEKFITAMSSTDNAKFICYESSNVA